MFLERSSFRGRGRVLDKVGDPGSFFTMILGFLRSARALQGEESCQHRLPSFPRAKRERGLGLAYAPEGDDLAAAEAPVALGLLLPPNLRGAAFLAAGEATSGVLWADEGDWVRGWPVVAAVEGGCSSEEKDCLS